MCDTTIDYRQEQWKEIGDYRISNYGRVTNSQGILLKCYFKKSKGETYIDTYHKEPHQIYGQVKYLVAEAFVDNPNGYNRVIHIDGNPRNNRADNLQWVKVTSKQARAYSKVRMPQRKLTDEQVREIRKKYIPRVYTIMQLADEYNVETRIIERIIHRKTYKDVR